MKIAVLCNLTNRRVKFFLEAAQKLGFPPPILIEYEKVLNNINIINDALYKCDVLRIESYGEWWETEKRLILLGTSEEEKSQLNLEDEFSNTRIQKAAYKGLEILMKNIEEILKKHPQCRCPQSPSAILMMNDKVKTHICLKNNDIRVPQAFYEINDVETMLNIMNEQNWTQVFIKPRHGSSACGVVAFRRNQNQWIAYSSLKKINGNFYNVLQVNKTQDKNMICEMLKYVFEMGVIVEQWIPKLTFQKQITDLRVVAYKNESCQTVLRCAKHAITNLHLGNQRGDLEAFRTFIGMENWVETMMTAQKVVQAIPGACYAGVDLAWDSSKRKLYVLEANAFGDLLPNVLHHGFNTYETYLQKLNLT